MSKFNVEVAFNDLLKKVAALTVQITTQTALIESQNKKIDDQQQRMERYFVTITEQSRVLAVLSTKIEKFEVQMSTNTSKSEMDKPSVIPATQRVNEACVATDAQEPQRKETERARRATERAKNKAASIPQKNSECLLETPEIALEKDFSSEEWKVVNNKKKAKKVVDNAIKKGGNAQIAAIQAIQRKKYLHVWSLHPDTSEKAICEHVVGICGTDDIKVEKIIPKSKRDYASFMIGVPESLFEKVNNVDSWPLNARFNQWVWFRNSRKPTQGDQSQE